MTTQKEKKKFLYQILYPPIISAILLSNPKIITIRERKYKTQSLKPNTTFPSPDNFQRCPSHSREPSVGGNTNNLKKVFLHTYTIKEKRKKKK